MKKMFWGLTFLIMFFPIASFAQTLPQAPASWVAFQKQESVKRAAFFKELKSDRDAFLSTNPEVKSYLDQVKATSKARMAAWRAQHHIPNHPNSPYARTATGF